MVVPTYSSKVARYAAPPPVRKIETKGRIFLAAPRTRAVTALPEPEGLPSRAGGAVTLTRAMSAFAAFFLTALTLALLAYAAGRSDNHQTGTRRPQAWQR